jgi:hypothetical protein
MRPLQSRIPLVAALPLLLLLATTACRTFNVHSDWDETASFDGLHRYAWLEPPASAGADPFADNSLLRKRVRVEIEKNLSSRGFEAVTDPSRADFLVTYGVVLDEKLRVNGGFTGYGGFGYGGRWPIGYGGAYGAPDVRNYQEGTLIVDFLRPADRELFWRGWAAGFLQTRDRDPDPRRFEAGVKAVLDAFPPKEPPKEPPKPKQP